MYEVEVEVNTNEKFKVTMTYSSAKFLIDNPNMAAGGTVTTLGNMFLICILKVWGSIFCQKTSPYFTCPEFSVLVEMI